MEKPHVGTWRAADDRPMIVRCLTALGHCRRAEAQSINKNVLTCVCFFHLPREPGWRNWQTQRTQNPPGFGPWGFDSPSRHQLKFLSFTRRKFPALHGRSSVRIQHKIRDTPAGCDRFRFRRLVPAHASRVRAGTCDHAKRKSWCLQNP